LLLPESEVEEEEEEVPAELALELPGLDPVVADDPQAATVMAAPRIRLPPSSRWAGGRR